jgi:hypothetical protein
LQQFTLHHRHHRAASSLQIQEVGFPANLSQCEDLAFVVRQGLTPTR